MTTRCHRTRRSLLLAASLGGITAAIAGAALAVATRRRWTVVTVDGPSMEPTFRRGDLLLIRRIHPHNRISRGDVVVLEKPDLNHTWLRPPHRRPRGPHWMIKRVTGIPGDPVPPGTIPDYAPLQPRVPAGTLIALGDNPASSYDSRQIGYIPLDRVTRHSDTPADYLGRPVDLGQGFPVDRLRG